MSKRKNRKQSSRPNLPDEVLARARREAGLEPDATEDESLVADEVVSEAVATPEAAAPRPQSSLPPIERRRSSSSRRRQSKPEEMTQAEIAERLANPTRQVTTEQLRTQYGYVLADLRSMGLLAGLLFVAMIVAANFL